MRASPGFPERLDSTTEDKHAYSVVINPVRSYLTTDQNGRQIVVNMTEPGHLLHPGHVVRYVTPSDGGATIQNEGEGAGVLQGTDSPGWLRDWINNNWRGLYQEHLDRSQ